MDPTTAAGVAALTFKLAIFGMLVRASCAASRASREADAARRSPPISAVPVATRDTIPHPHREAA
jgi:hypothetical protein